LNWLGGRFVQRATGLLALLLATGCDTLGGLATSPAPAPRPAVAETLPPEAAPVLAERSDASLALSTHYQRVQNDLLARGLLRTDGGGPDTTFTDTILARNFVRIALFDEFVNTPTGLRAQPTISRLRRWEQPIRFTVEHGATIPEEQRLEDEQNVSNFVNRLSRVTGHPMSVTDETPNFHVLFLNEDDRLGYADRIRELVPGIGERSVQAFLSVPRDTLCLVLAFSVNDSPEYSQAIAMIRGEHPDLMRLSCIHEELAQGLGLANDSPRARPSIFNDDEEFGLLTSHDELLLRMLYDDRLQTGMAAAEAAPIARIIASDLMNSGPS